MSKILLHVAQNRPSYEPQRFAKDSQNLYIPDFYRHSLIKHWHHNNLGLHLHLRLAAGFTDLKRGEYCAFFQPSATNEFDTSKRVRTTNIDVDFARHAARATDSNFFVLIPFAKGVKHREMLGVRHLF